MELVINVTGLVMARKNKFNAVRTEVDGITFASKREAARYGELKLLEKAGEISRLVVQPEFPILMNGKKCAVYRADFGFFNGKCRIIEDVKSPATKTAVYRLKKKLVEALYNIEIHEV